jgi:hypothetical protein
MAGEEFVVIGRVELSGTTSAAEMEKTLGGGGLGGAATEADSALGGLATTSTKAGEEAEKSATKHRGLGSAFGGLSKGGLGLNSVLGGLAGTFAGGFVALEAGKWLTKGIMQAADMQQQTVLLNRTMEQAAGITPQVAEQTDKWAESMSRQYGISHEKLLPDLSKLVASTHSVSASEKLMGTAANIAAGRHMDLDAVVKALAKGAQGSTGGLARLGLATKDAGGHALTMAQIMKQANKTYGGDAAAAANTTAGRMAVLGETFSQTKEKIMTDLVPVFDVVLTGLTKVAAFLPVLGGVFEKAWRDVIGPAVQWAWTNALQYVFKAIELYITGFLIPGVKEYAHWAEWAWKHVIGPTVKVVWTDILKPTWDLIKTYIEVQIKIYQTVAAIVLWAWRQVIGPVVKAVWTDFIKPTWDLVISYINNIIKIVQTLASWFTTAFHAIANVVTSVWNVTLKPIFTAIEKGIGVISKALGLVGKVAKTVGGTVNSFMKGAASAFAANLDNMAGPGSGGSTSIPGNVQQVVQTIAGHLGWSVSDWDKVISRESGGSLTAQNPTSKAYGIAQFIQGPSEYYQWGGNPSTISGQLIAMANYMASRYGNPTNAWAHEVKFGWYDQGGFLPPKSLTLAMNSLSTPEPVGRTRPVTADQGKTYYLTVQANEHEAAVLQAMIARAT